MVHNRYLVNPSTYLEILLVYENRVTFLCKEPTHDNLAFKAACNSSAVVLLKAYIQLVPVFL